MVYNFDKVIDRCGTDSSKWDGGSIILKRGYTTRFDEETIPLFIADMDFLCAPALIEAIKQVADRGIYGYTSIVDSSYRMAVKRWFYQYNKWEVDEENIVYAHGTMSALQDVLEIFTSRDDGIIIMPPVYSGFDSMIKLCKRKSIYCHLIKTENNEFYIDFDEFKKMAQETESKAVLICNPHNPIGRVWTEKELKKIIDISRENNLFVLSDDVHCDLTRSFVKYIPAASVSDYEKIITFTSLSKTFNLAGLYISHVLFQNSDLRKIYCEGSRGDVPSPFDIAVVKAAYNECGDWVNQLRIYLDENVKWAAEYLESNISGLKCTRPEGSYIIWLDFEKCSKSKEEVRYLIFDKANVMLASGNMFDPSGNGFCYRACLGASKAVISEAMRRIVDAFRG